MKTVFIVDDSPTARMALRTALKKDSDIIVVGEASNGTDAMAGIHKYSPDLVLLDVILSKESGLDLARTIMRETPRPILIVTSMDPSEPWLVYSAMQKGALDVMGKLPHPEHKDYPQIQERFLKRVRLLSEVPVHKGNCVRRKPDNKSVTRQSDIPDYPHAAHSDAHVELLMIGASTGGPPLVQQILQSIEAPAPIPIVVVQHITEGFAEGFARWLRTSTGHNAVLVNSETTIEGAKVYVSPDNADLVFTDDGTLNLIKSHRDATITPSINRLFQSATRRREPKAAILLTGMGSDGVDGLDSLHRSGTLTVAQHPGTCAVSSMPQNAIDRGAADLVMKPEQLASWCALVAAKGHGLR